MPIASRRDNFLSALGELTLDLSAGYNNLSDFGSLSDWSAGLTWGSYNTRVAKLGCDPAAGVCNGTGPKS